jgi:hypothetical protein
MRDGQAEIKMTEVSGHLHATYFGWIGGTANDAVFSYRIESPVVLSLTTSGRDPLGSTRPVRVLCPPATPSTA